MSSPEQENQSADNTILEKNKDEEQISDGGNKEGILQEADAHEYVTGIELFIILAVVTLVFFLLMLDMSIVTNVCPTALQDTTSRLTIERLYQLSQIVSIRLRILGGMEACILSQGVYQLYFTMTTTLMPNSSAALQPLTGKIYTYYSSKVHKLLGIFCLGLTFDSGPSSHFSSYLRSARRSAVQRSHQPC